MRQRIYNSILIRWFPPLERSYRIDGIGASILADVLIRNGHFENITPFSRNLSCCCIGKNGSSNSEGQISQAPQPDGQADEENVGGGLEERIEETG